MRDFKADITLNEEDSLNDLLIEEKELSYRTYWKDLLNKKTK